MVGTILLDSNNRYVSLDGDLPPRPWFDKEFITKFYRDSRVSTESMLKLPKSIQTVVQEVTTFPSHAVSIPELDKCDVLLVVRAKSDLDDGSIFRLDNFKQISKGDIEVWIKQ